MNWILNPSALPLLEYHSPLVCKLPSSPTNCSVSQYLISGSEDQQKAFPWALAVSPWSLGRRQHDNDLTGIPPRRLHTSVRLLTHSTPGGAHPHQGRFLGAGSCSIDHPKAAGFPVSLTAEPGSTYLLWWHCHAGLCQVCLRKAKQQVMSRKDWNPISSPRTNQLKGIVLQKQLQVIFLWLTFYDVQKVFPTKQKLFLIWFWFIF